MKRVLLGAAAAVIVFANAAAWIHGARNRAGQPQAEIVLTDRELWYQPGDSDDSIVTLLLRWTYTSFDAPGVPGGQVVEWLDRSKLQSIGFDCSVDPSDKSAELFYRRQRSRKAFVALEYDGPAWRAWIEAQQAAVVSLLGPAGSRRESLYENSTHLAPIDAGLDADALRARHPDRHSVLIVPAIVVAWVRGPTPKATVGRIVDLPQTIEVPLPYSDGFRRIPRLGPGSVQQRAHYRVHLSYGASLEPWVTGVEFVSGP